MCLKLVMHIMCELKTTTVTTKEKKKKKAT
jgi:hypothetical protein